MFKIVVVTALLGVLLLLAAIIILVSYNWSDKFYGQFTALVLPFVAMVAALIVVLAMLKGETLGDAFTTFIIVNRENHLPAPLDIDANHFCTYARPKFTRV